MYIWYREWLAFRWWLCCPGSFECQHRLILFPTSNLILKMILEVSLYLLLLLQWRSQFLDPLYRNVLDNTQGEDRNYPNRLNTSQPFHISEMMLKEFSDVPIHIYIVYPLVSLCSPRLWVASLMPVVGSLIWSLSRSSASATVWKIVLWRIFSAWNGPISDLLDDDTGYVASKKLSSLHWQEDKTW